MRKHLTLQQASEPLAEPELFLGCYPLVIQVVIAIRIQQAVSNNRGCNPDLRAKQRLQSTGGPGISASLNNIGHTQRFIESPSPPRERCTHREKIVREQLGCLAFQAQGSCR